MQEGGGWGAIIICASDKSVLCFLLCLWCFRALGWCFETLRHAGPSPSFSEKGVHPALSGPRILRRTLSGEEGGGIMKGVALYLSLPLFVRCFVSLRQVSRLSNLSLLIFCDTHTYTQTHYKLPMSLNRDQQPARTHSRKYSSPPIAPNLPHQQSS